METSRNGNVRQRKLTGEAARAQAMTIVQSFVQMWIKYESAVHKEIARLQQAGGEVSDSRKASSYVDYGIFYRVSSGLYRKKVLTMGELSSALSVPFSTATRIVDVLVADGLVQRTQDPEDRRVVRVALTVEGEKLHHTIERFTGEHVQALLSCLNEEEQGALFSLISKVNTALEKAT
jgi:DNA-binding MarR family transcriptional regulator